MTANVISMAERTNDGTLETPEQLLERTLARIWSGELGQYNKAIVLMLDDEAGGYSVKAIQCGMHHSESIALLEFGKDTYLRAMRGE